MIRAVLEAGIQDTFAAVNEKKGWRKFQQKTLKQFAGVLLYQGREKKVSFKKAAFFSQVLVGGQRTPI